MHIDVRERLIACGREADRVLALLRILLALVLGAVLLVATLAPGASGPLLEVRQVFLGAGLLAAYLLVGLIALFLAGASAWRATAWLLALFDAAFLLVGVALLLRATGLPANLVAAFPMVWLAPLFLAFAAARLEAPLILFQLLLLAVGLPLVMLQSGAWTFDLADLAPAPYDLFFSVTPNLLRFAALLATGLLLYTAARRVRRLLKSVAREAGQRSEARRFLPPSLLAALPAERIEALTRGLRAEVVLALIEPSALAERGAEVSAEARATLLSELEVRLSKAAEARGGLLLGHGPRALVVFGLAGDLPPAARSALAFARDLLKGGEEKPALLVALTAGELDLLPLGEAMGSLLPLGPALGTAERLLREARSGGRMLVASSALVEMAGELPSDLGATEIEVRSVEGIRPVELHSRSSVA